MILFKIQPATISGEPPHCAHEKKMIIERTVVFPYSQNKEVDNEGSA